MLTFSRADLGTQSFNNSFIHNFSSILYILITHGFDLLQEPIPRSGWDGILDTTSNTKTCPQLQLMTTKFAENITEDCLVLNVYLPTVRNDKNFKEVYKIFTTLPQNVSCHSLRNVIHKYYRGKDTANNFDERLYVKIL